MTSLTENFKSSTRSLHKLPIPNPNSRFIQLRLVVFWGKVSCHRIHIRYFRIPIAILARPVPGSGIFEVRIGNMVFLHPP